MPVNVNKNYEVTVTPEEWQIDYKKNFGTKLIRLNMIDHLRSLKDRLKLIDISNNYSKLNTKLDHYYNNGKISKEEYERQRLLNNDNYYNAVTELPMEGEYDYDITEETKRLYDIWNSSGRPTISNLKSFVNYIPGNEDRPNYSPITNTTYSTSDGEDVIAEISHGALKLHGKRNKWYHYAMDFPKTLIGELDGSLSLYGDIDHYEGETHGLFEKEAENYIRTGNKPSWVKSVKNGSKLISKKRYFN